jgi:hypothetical protein
VSRERSATSQCIKPRVVCPFWSRMRDRIRSLRKRPQGVSGGHPRTKIHSWVFRFQGLFHFDCPNAAGERQCRCDPNCPRQFHSTSFCESGRNADVAADRGTRAGGVETSSISSPHYCRRGRNRTNVVCDGGDNPRDGTSRPPALGQSYSQIVGKLSFAS